MINGGHIDSTDPQIISRWLEFLDIYVAQKVPTPPNFLAGLVLDQFTSSASGAGTKAPALPATRFTKSKSLLQAETAFAKKTPRVEVFFDSGADPKVGPGDPSAPYSAAYTSWPPKGKALTYYFGTGASLNSKAPSASSSATFTLDPSVRPSTDLLGGNVWSAAPNWNWTPVPAADSLAFQTAPFTKATTIVGPATVNLWVESSTPVEDYQVTVTEARPLASQEEYVTSGFLRSSNQTSLADSTKLYTDPNYQAAYAKNLSPTSWSLVKIPVDPIAHTFRVGTELRIVISAPGGDRPAWEFATVDSVLTPPPPQATVGMGGVVASSLVVNKVGTKTSTPTPTCGTLRGEPCRPLQAGNNLSTVSHASPPAHRAKSRRR